MSDTPGRPSPRARPARRGAARLTEDGRPVREVLSYARRGSRFTPSQEAAWVAHHEDWVIPVDDVDDPGFVLADRFGRAAPLVVEVGSGVGEATAALAAAHPELDVLALEVWVPGIAASLAEVARVGATNVRFCALDAVWAFENLVGSGALAGLWTFFPDPWPKTRHHKRRLVDPAFAALAADRLAPGATWRLATDWAAYADVMAAVLDAEPRLSGGVVERWEERPMTKFERKGIAVGRAITDLAYQRV
ncbi:tRNA (guanine-N7)-methyltransferase [Nocardioides bigeumensis]|uniref:tRNA (guanine-N(7)-)-methyltransferase n=1 Tax=Nocardioides bigeumensis TaxID=433657 RepID=A0ABP5KAP9_9ACTN